MHRVAIANRRLISLDKADVTFRYKHYCRDGDDVCHCTIALSGVELTVLSGSCRVSQPDPSALSHSAGAA